MKTEKIRGIARLDRRTKRLVKRLRRGEIAVIDHQDIDALSAQSLVQAGVKAVINTNSSFSGTYPARGAVLLLAHQVPLIDEVCKDAFDVLREGQPVEIEITADAAFISSNGLKLRGTVVTAELLRARLEEAKRRLSETVQKFAENTLRFMQQEGSALLSQLISLPPLRTQLSGRQVVVAVRGENYKEDLKAIAPYIREQKPVLIGVDGGADALLELGFKPHIILGDMDSVSDEALKCGAELIVHAYPGGEAPGMKRIEALGLSAHPFAIPGTSEDAALLLCYEGGASLIVAVGTHSSLIEFLEKGRSGMSSTFLTRLKVGHILVDAKGVSQLYTGKLKLWQVLGLLGLGVLVASIILNAAPGVFSFLRPFWLWLWVSIEHVWQAIF